MLVMKNNFSNNQKINQNILILLITRVIIILDLMQKKEYLVIIKSHQFLSEGLEED